MGPPGGRAWARRPPRMVRTMTQAQSALRTTLEAGTHVVCDRYAYSGMAYSVAKGMDLAWWTGPRAPRHVVEWRVHPVLWISLGGRVPG